MKAKTQTMDQLPPGGRILKPAATGQERAEALRNIRNLSSRAAKRAEALGMTDADIKDLVNER